MNESDKIFASHHLNIGRVDQLEDPGSITPENYIFEVDTETGHRTIKAYIPGSPEYRSPQYIWTVDPETGHRRLGKYIGRPSTDEIDNETIAGSSRKKHVAKKILGLAAIAGSAFLASCSSSGDDSRYNPNNTPEYLATPIPGISEPTATTEPFVVIPDADRPNPSDYENPVPAEDEDTPLICPPGDEDEDCDNWG